MPVMVGTGQKWIVMEPCGANQQPQNFGDSLRCYGGCSFVSLFYSTHTAFNGGLIFAGKLVKV